MNRLVEFPLKEGGSIVVEIDELEMGGTVRAGCADTILQRPYNNRTYISFSASKIRCVNQGTSQLLSITALG